MQYVRKRGVGLALNNSEQILPFVQTPSPSYDCSEIVPLPYPITRVSWNCAVEFTLTFFGFRFSSVLNDVIVPLTQEPHGLNGPDSDQDSDVAYNIRFLELMLMMTHPGVTVWLQGNVCMNDNLMTTIGKTLDCGSPYHQALRWTLSLQPPGGDADLFSLWPTLIVTKMYYKHMTIGTNNSNNMGCKEVIKMIQLTISLHYIFIFLS